MSQIVIVGLNYKTAPVEVRERLAFPQDTIGHALREAVAAEGVSEGVILSTCNRVEVCVLAEEGRRGAEGGRHDRLHDRPGIPGGPGDLHEDGVSQPPRDHRVHPLARQRHQSQEPWPRQGVPSGDPARGAGSGGGGGVTEEPMKISVYIRG